MCTDQSVDTHTLQRLTLQLADQIEGGICFAERCHALSARLFSPEAAVKQIVSGLQERH